MATGVVLSLKRVYLGLGSNLGDRQANLQTAIQKLESPGLHLCRISPLYETAALLYTAQGDFLNCVVEADTELLPLRLLHRIKGVERAMGRKRTVSKGPRNIDIDILLYGSSVIRSPELQIPHPGMPDRRFVLAPLADLAPKLIHPVIRMTIQQMLTKAPEQRLARSSRILQLPAMS